MRNRFIDQYRRYASRPGMVAIDGQFPQLPCRPNQIDSIELRELEASLDALPDSQRMVVLSVGLEGYTYEEVSTFMNVPMGTVKSRLSRGRATLRLVMQVDSGEGPFRGPKVSAPGHPAGEEGD
jgi:RNA polymerase sigma-70 factor (ECF subfamily)